MMGLSLEVTHKYHTRPQGNPTRNHNIWMILDQAKSEGITLANAKKDTVETHVHAWRHVQATDVSNLTVVNPPQGQESWYVGQRPSIGRGSKKTMVFQDRDIVVLYLHANTAFQTGAQSSWGRTSFRPFYGMSNEGVPTPNRSREGYPAAMRSANGWAYIVDFGGAVMALGAFARLLQIDPNPNPGTQPSRLKENPMLGLVANILPPQNIRCINDYIVPLDLFCFQNPRLRPGDAESDVEENTDSPVVAKSSPVKPKPSTRSEPEKTPHHGPPQPLSFEPVEESDDSEDDTSEHSDEDPPLHRKGVVDMVHTRRAFQMFQPPQAQVDIGAQANGIFSFTELHGLDLVPDKAMKTYTWLVPRRRPFIVKMDTFQTMAANIDFDSRKTNGMVRYAPSSLGSILVSLVTENLVYMRVVVLKVLAGEHDAFHWVATALQTQLEQHEDSIVGRINDVARQGTMLQHLFVMLSQQISDNLYIANSLADPATDAALTRFKTNDVQQFAKLDRDQQDQHNRMTHLGTETKARCDGCADQRTIAEANKNAANALTAHDEATANALNTWLTDKDNDKGPLTMLGATLQENRALKLSLQESKSALHDANNRAEEDKAFRMFANQRITDLHAHVSKLERTIRELHGRVPAMVHGAVKVDYMKPSSVAETSELRQIREIPNIATPPTRAKTTVFENFLGDTSRTSNRDTESGRNEQSSFDAPRFQAMPPETSRQAQLGLETDTHTSRPYGYPQYKPYPPSSLFAMGSNQHRIPPPSPRPTSRSNPYALQPVDVIDQYLDFRKEHSDFSMSLEQFKTTHDKHGDYWWRK